MFSGVEVEGNVPAGAKLEKKELHFSKYACYKHIGSYAKLHESCVNMKEELKRQGYTSMPVLVEIYGHWTNDESKLETEILISLD
jgi:effector-binding domain-containing protein